MQNVMEKVSIFGWRFVRTFLASVMLFACGVCHASDQKSSYLLRVTATDNVETTLTLSAHENFEFSMGEFEIKFLPGAIKSITRVSGSNWNLVLTNGETVKTVSAKSGQLSGKSEWGETRIQWNKIKSIAFNVAEPDSTSDSSVPGMTNENMQKPSTVQWEVTSSSGANVKLYQWNGQGLKIKLQEMVLSIQMNQVQSIERVPGEKNNVFKLLFVDGKSLVGSLEFGFHAQIGNGPLGSVALEPAKIKSLNRVADAPKSENSDAATRSMGELSTKSGQTLAASLTQWNNMNFIEEDVQISPKNDAIESIEAEPGKPGKYKINGIPMIPGSRRRVALVDMPPLRFNTPYGEASVDWVGLERFTAASPTNKNEVTPPANAFALKTKAGVSMEVWDFRPESSSNLNSEKGSQLRKINWEAVQSVANNDGVLTLTGNDGATYSFKNCEFQGTTALGHICIDSARISGLQIPSQATTGAANLKTIAKVILEDGTALDAVKVEIDGTICDHSDWLKGYCEFQKKGLYFWVAKDFVLSHGFKVQKNGVTANLRGAPETFDKANLSLMVTNSLVTLDLPSGAVAELIPVETPSDKSVSSASSTPASPQPEAEVVLVGGEKEKFAMQKACFVNYPRYGWSGSYLISQWPFQWWRSDAIDIKKQSDNTEIAVAMDKLASISVVGRRYTGTLKLGSKAGSSIVGTHIREDLNADRKSGPSCWLLEKEGVVFTLNPKMFVFVPFVAIEGITLP